MFDFLGVDPVSKKRRDELAKSGGLGDPLSYGELRRLGFDDLVDVSHTATLSLHDSSHARAITNNIARYQSTNNMCGSMDRSIDRLTNQSMRLQPIMACGGYVAVSVALDLEVAPVPVRKEPDWGLQLEVSQ